MFTVLNQSDLFLTTSMDTVADRIQSLMMARGLTQADLMRATHASKGTVSKWLAGTNLPSGRYIAALAGVLGTSSEHILTGAAYGKPGAGLHQPTSQSKPHTTTVLVGLEPWEDGDPLGADEVDLPYFEDVAFAAGDGSFLSQVGDQAGRKLRFLRETLRAAGVDVAHAACAKNSGNSMEDLIRDGATIGIDISKAELPIRDGKIYAMFHGGILRVKYLHRLPGGGVRLRSHNRDEYPDEDLTREQLADFRVLGWVFWWSTVDRW